MDRRSILFVLGLTLIFFVMHQWFDFGKGFGGRPLDQPNTQITILDENAKPTLMSNAQMDKFEIVKFYRDNQLRDFVTFAVRQDENFVTLAWEENLPEELFIRFSPGGNVTTRKVTLSDRPNAIGDPVLYTFYPASKIETAWVPDEGSFPVFFVYFEGNKAFLVKGTTDKTAELTLNAPLPANAIGLFPMQNTTIPYCYYDKTSDQINYLNHVPKFEDHTIVIYPDKLEDFTEQKKMSYYVLENQFQQLVFSDLNGDLVEINLPFTSEEHQASVVRPISFDRIIKENYPNNANFPLAPYYSPESGEKKLPPKFGGYYPLYRRNLYGSGGDISTIINPYYYGFNIFEDEIDPSEKLFKLKRFEKNLIEFELSDGNRRITKTYSFPKDPSKAPYVIDLAVKTEGDVRNLHMTAGIPEVELISGSFNPSLKYRITRNQKTKVEEIKTPKEYKLFSYVQPDWIANGNGFFGIIVDPLTKLSPGFSVHPASGELVPTRLSIIDSEYGRFPAIKYPGYGMHVFLPKKQGLSKFRIFAGPFDKHILNKVDETYRDSRTGTTPQYSEAQSYHGWFSFISLPFAKFLFILMSFFHKLTHSWGISIILLTIALRLMLYPLNNWSMKSMAKMKEIGPKVKALEQKYKKDPQRAKLEAMQLYRKEGVNPLGGCFPILIQLPFLFGMFDLLKSSFALRGASFIPGWINNLTAPDVLFTWSYPIPFIGNSFHLLPILLGVTMFMQQRISSASNVSGQSDDQARQQRFMGNMMTVVFTVLFYNFPSGLNIYWISSTLLGILQQWMMNKKIAAKGK